MEKTKLSLDREEKYWRGKKVFISGCNGFLGSWLSKALVDCGAEVTGLIKEEIPDSLLVSSGYINKMNIVHGSIESYRLMHKTLQEYHIDTYFHLAAKSTLGRAYRNPLSAFRANILGGCNVLEACRKSPDVKRVVIVSSDKAYGSHKILPYKETFKLKGIHPYGASKSCLDILSEMYFYSYGLPVGISRCANIYGPGDLNFSRIIPDVMKALILNKNPIIRSDGKFIRDYIFIEDAVESFLILARSLDREDIKGEVFNFSNQKPIKVLDLVHKIMNISGKTRLKPVILSSAEHEIRRQYLDCEKARKVLKWRPRHDFDKSLKRTYTWYKNYFKEKRVK